MKERIHKFKQADSFILLDVNSGAVHVVDEMIYDIMDVFDGANDRAVVDALGSKYPRVELSEALEELHELMALGELFAPDIDVPPTFSQKGLVKSLCLMVAQDCNLRCKYCFGDGGNYGMERAVMSPEVGCRAVDFLIEGSGPRKHCEIDFFGGEPLLNMKTIKKVTEHIRKREKETGKIFKLTLTTNGMLLNDANIAWLNENDFSLVLSLDGRRETNDAMRPDVGGHGTYDRIVENFRRCLASRAGGDWDYRGVYTYLRGTYTKRNLDFTEDVLSMHDAGFNILSVEPVVLKDSPLALMEEDLPRIREEYDRLAAAYMERHQGILLLPLQHGLVERPLRRQAPLRLRRGSRILRRRGKRRPLPVSPVRRQKALQARQHLRRSDGRDIAAVLSRVARTQQGKMRRLLGTLLLQRRLSRQRRPIPRRYKKAL